MAVNLKIVSYVLWLVALTTTVKGYKSCGEIQDSKQNVSSPYFIELGKKQVEVSCNLTSQPAVTTIVVKDVVRISNPGAYGRPTSFLHNVNYRSVSLDSIKVLIEHSEVCKQYVSYKCTNATLFGNNKSPLSTWTSTDDGPRNYWAGCSFSDQACKCDKSKGMTEEDAGYLTNKADLPVKSLQIGGLSSHSNVSILIGNIMCYGDNQKGAITLENQNAFVSLNVSSMKELKFKFKLVRVGKSKTIAVLRIKNETVWIRMDSESSLNAGHIKFGKLNTEWHSIALNVEGKTTYAVVDNGKKKAIYESQKAGTDGAKLVLGDPERNCNAFIGCVKDLTVDGQDYTNMMKGAKMQEFVKEGCTAPRLTLCSDPKVRLDVDTISGNKTDVNDSDDDGGKSTTKPGYVENDDDGGKSTTKPVYVEHDGGGGNDDAAIIAIVVVFLILLIILIVVFAVTWYLKRNKGVYQTHEGSAENLHGDTDNLTLVTRPGEQENEGDKGKEYYL